MQPPPGYAPPVPPGRPPRRRGRTTLIVVLVVIGGLALAGGGLLVGMLGHGDSGGPRQPLSLDEPREPDAAVATGEEGGEHGNRIRTGLTAAGFACDGATRKENAWLVCSRSDHEDVPRVETVDVLIDGGRVSAVTARVELDPGWSEVRGDDEERPFSSGDHTISAVAFAGIGEVAAALVPAAEVPGVSAVIGDAHADPGSTQTVDTDLGRVSVVFGPDDARLTVTGEGSSTALNGLHFTTPDELQRVATDAGLTCESKPDTLICTSDALELAVRHPRPTGTVADHRIQDLSLSAAAVDGSPDPAMVELATALGGTVAGKVTDSGAATDRISACFGWSTQVAAVGANRIRCEPTVTGTQSSPELTGFRFTIEAL